MGTMPCKSAEIAAELRQAGILNSRGISIVDASGRPGATADVLGLLEIIALAISPMYPTLADGQ